MTAPRASATSRASNSRATTSRSASCSTAASPWKAGSRCSRERSSASSAAGSSSASATCSRASSCRAASAASASSPAAREALVGESTGSLPAGDAVHVKVERVDRLTGKVDLAPPCRSRAGRRPLTAASRRGAPRAPARRGAALPAARRAASADTVVGRSGKPRRTPPLRHAARGWVVRWGGRDEREEWGSHGVFRGVRVDQMANDNTVSSTNMKAAWSRRCTSWRGLRGGRRS